MTDILNAPNLDYDDQFDEDELGVSRPLSADDVVALQLRHGTQGYEFLHMLKQTAERMGVNDWPVIEIPTVYGPIIL